MSTVSVIIPCFNSERWLPATLDSVYAQAGPRLDVIVVDDGSTDGSVEVARRYESRGLRLLRQPNRGAAAARNAGLALATGDYLQFLDADDVLAPGKLQSQLTRLAGAPGRVAAGAWARFSHRTDEARWPARSTYRDFAPLELLLHLAETDAVIAPAVWLVPRAVAAAAGPWDEALSLNDDAEYFARVAMASAGTLHCEDARVYYRSFHIGSLSHRRDDAARRSRFRATESIAGALLAAEDSPRVRAACASLYRSFVRRMYPDPPDLIAEAERRIASLGGTVPDAWWKRRQRLRMAARRGLVGMRRMLVRALGRTDTP